MATHSRAAAACDVGSVVPDPDDGFDNRQGSLLRCRSRRGTTEEQWRQVYKILFPDDNEDLIPSPCMCTTYLPLRIGH